MKHIFIILIALSFSSTAFSQTKIFINKTSGTDSLWLSDIKNITFKTYSVVATETWIGVMDNDSLANHNAITFQKYTDGSIVASADWQYATTVQCPFTNGIVTIADSVLSVAASGTATNTAAPVGYQMSPFTVSVTDTVHNGKGHGTWTIYFTTTGWPSTLQGTEIITRTSGSGVTN